MRFDPSFLTVHGRVRALPGSSECGDAFCTFTTERYQCAALLDGVGHGTHAAEASRAAVEVLQNGDWGDLEALVRLADRSLRATRGVAMTLLRIAREDGALTHVGVGNIELRGASLERIRPITTPGVVGSGVRKVRERTYALHRGDVLAAYTDGVSSRFPTALLREGAPEQVAHHLMSDWTKAHDDAGCLVVGC